MKKIERGFNALFPSGQELWEKAGAEMVPTEAADGSIVDRPFFDLEVTNKDAYKKPIDGREELVTRRGRHLGFSAVHQVEVNGIDHLARAIVTDNRNVLTITRGTAWTTTINGYTHAQAIKVTADTLQPHLQVGPPHSGQNFPFWLEPLRVPQTVNEARAMSLARTAQIEQLIFSELSELYGLPSQQVALGDSRDSMTTPGQYLYAPMYGAEIVGFDTKARCMVDKMEAKDLLTAAQWAVVTVAGGFAVGLCLAKDGQLGALRGTTSANPNFWASSFTGTLRSLAGGEGRLLIDTVPRDAHGIDVIYGNDRLSHISDFDEIKDAWGPENHPGVYVKDVPRGTHSALLHPLAHTGTRQRVRTLVDEYRSANGNVDAMNWRRIHGYGEVESISASAA